jgi:hypothetical protein
MCGHVGVPTDRQHSNFMILSSTPACQAIASSFELILFSIAHAEENHALQALFFAEILRDAEAAECRLA